MLRSLLPLALSAFGAAAIAADAPKPNVLFIAVDDLNAWVGHLDRNKQTKTPNLDRLAAMGVTFTNAHCAAAVCNPSHTALKAELAKHFPTVNAPAALADPDAADADTPQQKRRARKTQPAE